MRGGAPKLALMLLDQEQTASLPPGQWMAWERQRLAVYAALRDWDALAGRAEHLPPDLPPEFRRYALVQAVEARLAAQDAEGARRYLRRLVFGERAGGAELAQVRRLVIRSYLTENNLADAQTALARYQQDYNARGEAWQTLHAEILMRAGKDRAAFDVAAGAQSHEARLMRLASALRAEIIKPAVALGQAEKLADELRAKPALARKAWAAAAEAALRGRAPAQRVLALERALSLPGPGDDPLFGVEPEDLWQAYERLAESIGNAARLLVGNDRAWLAKAESYKAADGHHARALYAFLAAHAAEDSTRAAAHQRLADGLLKEGYGETLRELYTRSARYGSVAAIPEVVRYRLADKALADFDIRLAAQLVKDLVRPPEDEDAEFWRLRRARVLIYAGDYHPALVELSGMLDDKRSLEPDLAGRYLQVLFDLQTAGKHEEAAVLLESVYARVDNERMRREILFWIADSKSAQGRYQEAAEWYLRSATFNGANGGDPWGETARFHAAEALGRAGFIEDARGVYLKLLGGTEDPRRRAQIERNIQQLWLAQNAPTR
ncbi:MAG: hypothetical protein A2151_07815 [Candidatus Muproteobacteria bacterium RBG_16_65_34]|uniref:Tetratricopeptide repeat protein n=1 Tax=Candidatus Muproteobacteria bacterium RBG_16_65_34 TaxID=1817760 RepID=A0A1F6TVH9_9PROT|nr:MAG: hypothetical protein A2151_07815 [Candidatus Muproteobacteria bacterium RBG_16_65_34]